MYQSLKFQVNYEAVPVVRPILSVLRATVHSSSCLIRENGAMVLNVTLVDRRDMTCDLVASIVPNEVPAAIETRDEEMRDSGNLSEYGTAQIPVL